MNFNNGLGLYFLEESGIEIQNMREVAHALENAFILMGLLFLSYTWIFKIYLFIYIITFS